MARHHKKNRRRANPAAPGRAKFEQQFQALQTQLAEHEKAIQRLRDQVRTYRGRLLRQSRGSAQTQEAAPTSIGRKTEEQVNYDRLVRRIQTAVTKVTRAQASVLVINKGDPALLKLSRRYGSPFPQSLNGSHTGYHPKTSTAAIAQLETMRAKGARYLVIPVFSLWWLSYYRQFREHLESRYSLVLRDEETCLIFDLSEQAARSHPSALEEAIAEFQRRFDCDPDILDWGTGLEPNSSLSHCTLATCAADKSLPYLDQSIDLVVISAAEPQRLADAKRVASAAVVVAPDSAGSRVIEWRPDRPEAAGVTTSIIIPTYNGLERVQACVQALRETLPLRFDGEIIIVDDASDSPTRNGLVRLAETYPAMRLLRNRRNGGFIQSCNAGATAATGSILIFLNDDTLPLPQWLDALLATFRLYPNAGAVGGKLIFPDGRLQEAGGVIFSDGSGANFGKWDHDLDHPLYCYVREVDYCSGALLATPRRLFEEIGGFDKRYCPAYYEDTDYCFGVRERGYAVYYQPESHVIHFEGASSGTDETTGTKRYQAINRSKFIDKWAVALKAQPAPPARFDSAAWHELAVRSFHFKEPR